MKQDVVTDFLSNVIGAAAGVGFLRLAGWVYEFEYRAADCWMLAIILFIIFVNKGRK